MPCARLGHPVGVGSPEDDVGPAQRSLARRESRARRPRRVKSPGWTSGIPTRSATTLCSYQAELSGPSLIRITTGSSTPSGAASRRASPSQSKTGSSGFTSLNCIAEELRAHLARGDGVRHARRRPRVVLEDEEPPVAVAHEVEADHGGRARSRPGPPSRARSTRRLSMTRAGITPSETIRRSP